MSTFKRLLNLGKGKVKVATRATREAAPSAPSGPSTDVLADARHAVADAAEALADVIRPEGGAEGEEVVAAEPDPDPVPAAADEAPTPGLRTDLGGAPKSGDEPTAPTSSKPAKRTL